MGENKIDKNQHCESINADDQEFYGSQQYGRHNLEGISSIITDNKCEDDIEHLFQHTNDFYQQFLDMEEEQLYTSEFTSEENSDQFGNNTPTGKLNDIEKAKSVSSVEGDDEDILGETENKHRNELQINATELNKHKPQSG